MQPGVTADALFTGCSCSGTPQGTLPVGSTHGQTVCAPPCPACSTTDSPVRHANGCDVITDDAKVKLLAHVQGILASHGQPPACWLIVPVSSSSPGPGVLRILVSRQR